MGLKDLGYKPRTTTVRIILDDTLRTNLERARAAYDTQKLEEAKPEQGLGSELPALQQAIDEATAAAEKAAVDFTFQALPRAKLADLINDCPPTETQLDQWKTEDRNNPLVLIPAPAFDVDKFPPRLIAASLTSPETTETEVVEMWETGDWSDAIWDTLWKTAWDKTNKGVSTLPTYGIGSKKT